MRYSHALLFTFFCGCTGIDQNPLDLETDDLTQEIVEKSVIFKTNELEYQLKDFSQYFMYQNQKMKLPDTLSLETSDRLLARTLFIDWSGPINVLLEELAQMSGYKFRAIGRIPVVPALVTLHHEKIALIDVISDVSLQVHQSADIAVFPEQKVIELRYKG